MLDASQTSGSVPRIFKASSLVPWIFAVQQTAPPLRSALHHGISCTAPRPSSQHLHLGRRCRRAIARKVQSSQLMPTRDKDRASRTLARCSTQQVLEERHNGVAAAKVQYIMVLAHLYQHAQVLQTTPQDPAYYRHFTCGVAPTYYRRSPSFQKWISFSFSAKALLPPSSH